MGVRIFVKRGEFERFDELHKAFAATTATQVAWDRRVRDRRKTGHDAPESDRRQQDRRSAPPASWTALAFVVARLAEDGHRDSARRRTVPS